jgi:ribosomal protein S15P/S13E
VCAWVLLTRARVLARSLRRPIDRLHQRNPGTVRSRPGGRFEPLPAWIVDQGRVWIDRQGRTHAIAEMSLAEARRAIRFCHEHSPEIQVAVLTERASDAIAHLARHRHDSEAASDLEQALGDGQINSSTWLRDSPLLQALERRATDEPDRKLREST